MTSTITLALWQLRRTWRLLLVTGAAMLIAVVLVCMVPLYSQAAISAGLRDAFNAAPNGPYIIVHSVAESPSQRAIQDATSTIDQVVQQALSRYINRPKELSIQDSLPFYEQTRTPTGKTTLAPARDQVALLGFSMSQSAAHLKLMQGRLPLDNAQNIEIAMTPQTAALINATVGSTIFVQLAFDERIPNPPFVQSIALQLPLHIVGLFTLPANDQYWHGEAFQPGPLTQPIGAAEPPERYPALVSQRAFLSTIIQKINAAAGIIDVDQIAADQTLETPLNLFWYYSLDTTHFDVNNLSDLNARFNNVLNNLSNNPLEPPFVDKTSTIGPLDVLTAYTNRITVVNIPLTDLSYLIVALILFFISLMTGLLVDRQAEAIALLRSRGASRRQIFGSLLLQSIAVVLLALILGPLLAILAALFMTQRTLSPTDQGVISLLTRNPLQVAVSTRWPALLTSGIAVLAMVISISRAIRMDTLSLRRETARSTQQPFWQRLHLDIVAAVIALVGYGFSAYVTASGVLNDRVQVLVLPATTVVGALFLLLACVLLLLRLFPIMLQFASNLASRSRGATPLLALAHIARSPRQSQRMTMLLALAVAFAIFTLSFIASQSQRISDVAAYQVGSDFSGAFQLSTIASFDSWQQQENAYRHIHGVTSATIGYVNLVPAAAGSLSTPIDMLVVNASTYASTTIWSSQDSTQSAASLMQQLIAGRALATSGKAVPAIVDASTASQLNLTIGSHFTINDVNNPVNAVVVAEVAHIPTINDSPISSSAADSTAFGGALLDFQGYSDYSSKVNSAGVTPNTIWLRTANDRASLASVRNALTRGPLQLTALNDRRAIITGQQSDPLYLTLLGVLIVSSITPLLLAIIGNLTLSWQTARGHLTNFAIMRALGSTPRQLIAFLTWEQGIVYTTSIILGIAFGTIFSAIALPVLIFTTVISTGGSQPISTTQFFIMQNTPPIQMVIPYSLMTIAVGMLIIVCLVALGMMARIASRPSISLSLRVSQD